MADTPYDQMAKFGGNLGMWVVYQRFLKSDSYGVDRIGRSFHNSAVDAIKEQTAWNAEGVRIGFVRNGEPMAEELARWEENNQDD